VGLITCRDTWKRNSQPIGKKRNQIAKQTNTTQLGNKRLIKQKIQEKFSQQVTATSSKTQWQNIKSTWENNNNNPRKQAVAHFRLNTGQKLANTCSFVGGCIIVQQEEILRAEILFQNPKNYSLGDVQRFCYQS
jgi:hypothetical protein